MSQTAATHSFTIATASRGVVLVAVAACHFAALAAIAGSSWSIGKPAAPQPFVVSLLPPPQATEPTAPTLMEPKETRPDDDPGVRTEAPPAASTIRLPEQPVRERALRSARARPLTAPPQRLPTPRLQPVPMPADVISRDTHSSHSEDLEKPEPPAQRERQEGENMTDREPALVAAAAPARSVTEMPFTPPRVDPAYQSNPKPRYPLAARRRGEEGTVLLHVGVAEDGRVTELRVERSSRSDRLDRAAMNAVADWRFVAARRGDVAIASSIQIPIVFRLED